MSHRFFLSLLTAFAVASQTLRAIDPPDASGFAYDANNRVTVVNHPDGRQAVMTYDPAGNLLSVSVRDSAPPVVVVGAPLQLTAGVAMADYSITLSRSAVIKGYKVSGLPKGLKANTGLKIDKAGRNPGTIYGTPEGAGVFQVSLSANTTAGSTAPVVLVIQVDNPYLRSDDGFQLAGRYAGLLPAAAETNDLGGSWSVQVSQTGAFTGTLILGKTKLAFKGAFDGVTGLAAELLLPLKTGGSLRLNLTLDLDPASATRGQITGTLGELPGLAIAAYREVWSKLLPATTWAPPKGAAYHVALFPGAGVGTLPEGVGYLRETVDSLGKAKVAGKLADGTKVTAAGVLWPDGSLPVFVPLYSGRGSLAGLLQHGVGAIEAAAEDNEVAGALDWSRPDLKGSLYPDGFSLAVDASGGVYQPPAKGERVLGLGSGAAHDALGFEFRDGGLTATLTGTLTLSTKNTVTAMVPNANGISLKFAATTGLVTGGFNDGGRKAKLEALILPENPLNLPEAWGFFLLPGAGSGAPILSGRVYLGQPD